MVPAATLVTVTIAGEAKGIQTKDDLLAAVVAELGYVPLAVVSSSIDAGSTLYNAVSFQWFHYQYRAVLTVSTPADYYDSIDEVGSDVRSAFEDVAGSTPTAVQVSTSNRTPAIDAPTGGSLLPDIGTAIESNVHGILLIVVALVVLLVVTLGWGKNIGRLAAAR